MAMGNDNLCRGLKENYFVRAHGKYPNATATAAGRREVVGVEVEFRLTDRASFGRETGRARNGHTQTDNSPAPVPLHKRAHNDLFSVFMLSSIHIPTSPPPYLFK